MIFAPYNTDAPIYHPPIATVVMIVINVVVFCLTTLQLSMGNIEDQESIEWLMLMFNTVNPLQWLTSAFMHADLGHLIGNMLFLWAFGLVVEGKIGPKRFTILYIALAMVQSAIVQVPMFIMGGESGALGASGAIFALMVITVLWAPENEMECFYLLGVFFWGTFEIRIFVLGLLFIALQMVLLFFSGFGMSSEMLHMAGVLVGIPAGIYMLRENLVDCEGWDLISRNPGLQKFSILCSDKQRAGLRTDDGRSKDPIQAALALGSGKPDPRFSGTGHSRTPAPVAQSPGKGTKKRTGKTQSADTSLPGAPTRSAGHATRAASPNAQSNTQPSVSPEADRAKTNPQFNGLAFMLRQAVESSNAAAAQQAFLRLDQGKLSIGLSEKALFGYVTLLGKRKQWVDALRPLQVVVMRNGKHADDARLRIAQIHLKVLNNPTAAIRVLQAFAPLTELSTEAEQARFAKRSELLTVAQRHA